MVWVFMIKEIIIWVFKGRLRRPFAGEAFYPRPRVAGFRPIGSSPATLVLGQLLHHRSAV